MGKDQFSDGGGEGWGWTKLIAVPPPLKLLLPGEEKFLRTHLKMLETNPEM